MHKVRAAMKFSGNHPMEGIVPVDEFVIGGKEKGKVGRSDKRKKKKNVCSVELTENGKVKRMYALKIDNYSSKELETIFEKQRSEQAKVTTDQWRGYRPLSGEYKSTQEKSMEVLISKLYTLWFTN
jgi:transposase-like protein